MTKPKQLRIVKKYQNRRLYDTATSMYIVLEDIKEYIIAGERVKVIDVKTEQDVTRSVLLQIILEEEVNKVPTFSDDFLFQIIRFYGKGFQASVGSFLENGVELFRKMQKQFYGKTRTEFANTDVKSQMEAWNEFISAGTAKMENSIKDYIETGKNTFLKMQENIKTQTENMLNYMQFPFNSDKTKK